MFSSPRSLPLFPGMWHLAQRGTLFLQGQQNYSLPSTLSDMKGLPDQVRPTMVAISLLMNTKSSAKNVIYICAIPLPFNVIYHEVIPHPSHRSHSHSTGGDYVGCVHWGVGILGTILAVCLPSTRQIHSYDIRLPDEYHQTSVKCPGKSKKRGYFLLAGRGQGLVGMAGTMCGIWVGRGKGEWCQWGRNRVKEAHPKGGKEGILGKWLMVWFGFKELLHGFTRQLGFEHMRHIKKWDEDCQIHWVSITC